MWSKIAWGVAFGVCAAMALNVSITTAQEPACRYFKVQTDNVNISKEPRGDST